MDSAQYESSSMANDSCYGASVSAGHQSNQLSLGSRSKPSRDSGHSMDTDSKPSGQSQSIDTDSGDEILAKRRRMMKCLQEIQSLVGYEMGRDNETALSTLQSVIEQIKKMKNPDENEYAELGTEKNKAYEEISEAAYNPVDVTDVGFCDDPFAVQHASHDRGDYRITVSCATRRIKEMSVALMSYIGFTRDELEDELFNKFIHEKDILTFATSVSSLDTGRGPSGGIANGEQEKTVSFFMRLLHNTARSWYSNTNRDRYSAMFSRVHVQSQSDTTVLPDTPLATPSSSQQRELVDPNAVCRMDSDISDFATSVHEAMQSSAVHASQGGKQHRKLFYVIDCAPMQSAYKIRDQLPERQCFSYKHSPSGMFTFIDPAAIPLLGYLPQDLVGTSIFQYYHPEDYSVLLTAYQALQNKPTKTVCSQPVRMRVRNGEFIIVATELSCFVNPWSHKLDFIIGKHSLVRGPRNLDVFAEYGSHKLLTNIFPECKSEHRDAQNEIMKTLNRTIHDKEPKKAKPTTKLCTNKSDGSVNSPKTDSSGNNKESKNTDDSHEGESSNLYSISGSSDFSQWDQQEINKVYNSLAYLQGIQRLLTSQDGPEEGGMRVQIPATETLHYALDSENSCISNGSITCSDEGTTGFPHPPSQPASSTKAMLLEDLDMQVLSPREPEATLQSDDNPPVQQRPLAPATELDMGTSGEPHVFKLTIENLQLHEQDQRNRYLQTMMKDNEMKLFYETLSVPKLIRNLRHRLLKRRAKTNSPDSHGQDIAIKILKLKDGAHKQPFSPNFPITSIEDAKPTAFGALDTDQAARPLPQVGAPLLHAHHPMHVDAFTAMPPVLSAAPLFGYSGQASAFRYGLSKSTAFVKPSSLHVGPSKLEDFSKSMEQHEPTVNPWPMMSPNLSPTVQPAHAQEQPSPVTAKLSLRISPTPLESGKKADCSNERLPQSACAQQPGSPGGDDDSSCSSAGLYESSFTDMQSSSMNDDKPPTRCPFWLEDLHPAAVKEDMFNYEMKLNVTPDIDDFYSTFSTKAQAPELYQQLLEFELGKLDLDLEEDSDTSSLFAPVNAEDMERQRASRELPAAANRCPVDPYTDTDSSSFVNTALLLQKKRKPRSTRPKTTAPPIAAKQSTAAASQPKARAGKGKAKEKGNQGSGKSARKVKQVTTPEELMEKGESESLENMETKSNTSNNGSDNSANTHSAKSDLSKDNSSKNSSSVGGYQGSAEMTSSNGDVYSVDDCSDYIDSNREFCKTYDKEKLMEYCVKLGSIDDFQVPLLPSVQHSEQPSLILDQLNELVFEFNLAAAAYANPDSVPEQSSALSNKSELESNEREVNAHAYAPAPEIAVCPAAPKDSKRESASQGDSGFQSGSTYDVYLRQKSQGFSTGGTSSSMISSNEGSYEKSSGSSKQGSNGGSSSNNGSSNDGGSSGMSNIQSGGSGSESVGMDCKEGMSTDEDKSIGKDEDKVMSIIEDTAMSMDEDKAMCSDPNDVLSGKGIPRKNYGNIHGSSSLVNLHKRSLETSENLRYKNRSENEMSNEQIRSDSQDQSHQLHFNLECSSNVSSFGISGSGYSIPSQTVSSLNRLTFESTLDGLQPYSQGQSSNPPIEAVSTKTNEIPGSHINEQHLSTIQTGSHTPHGASNSTSCVASEALNQIDISEMLSEEEMAISADSMLQFMESLGAAASEIRDEDALIQLLYRNASPSDEPGFQSL